MIKSLTGKGATLNHLKILNDTIDYVEHHLKEPIDKKAIEQNTTLSYPMISRIFGILSGVTLGQYIRFRRLSEAAKEIASCQRKIIDVATDYGYDSVDAFRVAFKQFHQISPSQVKNGGSYQSYPPMNFQITVKGGHHMKIKIEKREGFTVMADPCSHCAEELMENKGFNPVWENFITRLKKAIPEEINHLNFYGVYVKDKGRLSYYAACDGLSRETGKALALKTIRLPSAEYAVFTAKGPVDRVLDQGWEYIMGCFFPEGTYAQSDSPDFEYYAPGNRFAEEYETKIYIAIK